MAEDHASDSPIQRSTMWYRMMPGTRAEATPWLRFSLFPLAFVLIIAAVPYVIGGVMRAYFAGDDFDWLVGALLRGWRQVLNVSASDRYRPLVDFWFAGGVRVCGMSSGCYHVLSLLVHLVSVALVFALTQQLFDDLRLAVFATVLFALQPSYTQAVAWVAGIPDLLGACLYLTAMLLLARSWSAEQGRAGWEIATVVALALAFLVHESSITALAMAPLMWHQFGPSDWRRRPVPLIGAVLAAVGFVAVTVIANRRSYLFTESHYAIGLHMVRHLFEYLVDFYVGPGWWLAYTLCGVGVVLFLVATPITRFGVLWLLITLTPYLGFTWGNVSRYHYLPAVGFSWAIAAAWTAAYDQFTTRFAAYRPAARILYVILAVFLAVRFTRFCIPSVRSQVQWLEHWRAYVEQVVSETPRPEAHTIRIAPPTDELIESPYISAMFRWVYQDPTLTVTLK
jgi:hypothetical protein